MMGPEIEPDEWVIDPMDAEFLAEYIVHMTRLGRAENTILQVIAVIRMMMRELPHWAMADAAELEDWLDGKSYAASSRKQRVMLLRGFMTWNALGETTPADHLIVPTKTARGHVEIPISTTNLELVLRKTVGRMHLIIALGCYAGLRSCEIADLESRDIDFINWSLYVRQSKGNRSRYIALHPYLHELLSKTDLTEQHVVYRATKNHFYGNKLGANYISRVGAAAMRGLGVNSTMHDLRHWFITNLSETGNMEMARDAAGHSSLATTQGYVHVDLDRMRAAIAKIQVTVPNIEDVIVEGEYSERPVPPKELGTTITRSFGF